MAKKTRSVKTKRSTVVRLTANRPTRPARGKGPATVKAYFQALPPTQRAIARQFDALLARLVPGVKRTMMWRMPFYGVPGKGWFLSCLGRPEGVLITFFQGMALKPLPPLGRKRTRGVELHAPSDVDAARISSWIRQAAKLPGYAS